MPLNMNGPHAQFIADVYNDVFGNQYNNTSNVYNMDGELESLDKLQLREMNYNFYFSIGGALTSSIQKCSIRRGCSSAAFSLLAGNESEDLK